MKITGTSPPLVSMLPNSATDVPVVPSIPHTERGPSTSHANESLASTILPSLSSSALKEYIPAFVCMEDFPKNDALLDIMPFSNEEDDMELGNFLLDAAEWL